MILDKTTPVVVICRNRIRTLDTTLNSLKATLPPSIKIYISNDATTNPTMIKYLTTQENIQIDEPEYPNNNPNWLKYIGTLENRKTTQGIAGQFEVIIHSEPGGAASLGKAVKLAFDENPQASHVVKVEDDVIFKPHWYRNLVNTMRINSEIGMLSGYRMFFSKPKFTRFATGLMELTHGYCTGQAVGVSREVFDRCDFLYTKKPDDMRGNDDLWVNSCRNLSLKFCVVEQGIAQHIGLTSDLWMRGERTFMNDADIFRIDKNLQPPYATGE